MGIAAVPLNINAGWSSLEACKSHDLEIVGSNPTPVTIIKKEELT